MTLEVVAMDDRANADTGKQVAQQLVDSGVSIAAAPTYAEKNTAQLAISTNPKYTDLGHATTFRVVDDGAAEQLKKASRNIALRQSFDDAIGQLVAREESPLSVSARRRCPTG